MKKFYILIAIFAISAFLTSSVNIHAQAEKKQQLDLNEFLGARLYKVFKTFGIPHDLYCSSDGNNATIVDYGDFAFQIAHKAVTIVFFWNNFNGSVFGIKTGMTKNELIKQKGEPSIIKKSKVDDSLILVYKLIDTDRLFVCFVDKNNKIYRMQIEWIN